MELRWRRRWRHRAWSRRRWVDQNVLAFLVIEVAGGWRGRLRGWVRRKRRIVLAGLVDLHRVTVEVRVGEVGGSAAKVHQSEVILLRVLVDASSATDDLLELSHRTHGAVQDDQPASLRVDAGR